MLRQMAVLSVLSLCLPILATGAVLHVPSEQPTIQAGIDAAVDGDTVLVDPGTYVEFINFLGKSIALVSDQEPELTTIDGDQVASVVISSRCR